MESPLSSVRMHWDLELTPSPSQEGSRTAWPVPLLGGVRGGFVADGSRKAPPHGTTTAHSELRTLSSLAGANACRPAPFCYASPQCCVSLFAQPCFCL